MTGRYTSHDFASSRKPTAASPKRKGRQAASGGVPGWLWATGGTVAGVLVMYLVYVLGYAPPVPDRKAIVAAQQAGTTPAAPGATPAGDEPPAPPKRTSPVFEFYTKLPESGAAVDTAALPDPQAAAQPAPGTLPPDTAATAQAGTGEMEPIQQLMAQKEKEAAAAQPQPPPDKLAAAAPATDTAKPAVTPAPPAEKKTEATTKTGGRYALQTGAFRKRTEADAQRAKLLLLGMQASVQPASNGIYRVVVGPFANKEDLDDARIILDGNHISNIPVK